MLIRKLFRTAWSYRSQFISMIIMIAIGVGVFLGFNIEWKSIEDDTTDQLCGFPSLYRNGFFRRGY